MSRSSIREKETARRELPRALPFSHRPAGLNGTLPTAYAETRVTLIPVDPYRVHVYWEIEDRDRKYVKALLEQGALKPQALLRFHDVTALSLGGVRAAGSFDVEIDMEARNWYVHLLSPEKAYFVDLGFRGRDGRFHRIARSNRGETPRAWPCAETGEQYLCVTEVDGIVHVDPVEKPRPARDAGRGADLPEGRSRIEMPGEEDRAIARGGGGAPPAAETGPGGEAGPPRPAAPTPGPAGRERGVTAGRSPTGEGAQEAGARQREESSPPLRGGPVDGPAMAKARLEAIYSRSPGYLPQKAPPPAAGTAVHGAPQRPADIDLSLLCEDLFASGLSSGRIAAAREEEEEDER